MKRKGLLTLSALVFFACVLGCGIPRVYGQAAATGAILGTVTDPSGAVVPGATVTTTDTRTQQDRKSTRLNSSHSQISYAVFCLKKKKMKSPYAQSDYQLR